MKDSEKDERISNLKNILGNVKKDSEKKENNDDNQVSQLKEESDEIVEKDFGDDLINYEEDPKSESEEDEIDDEFIYTPSQNSDDEEIIEESSKIDEKFIIKTEDDDEFPEIDFTKDEKGDISSIKNNFKDDIDLFEDEEEDSESELSDNLDVTEQINNIFNYKIGKINIIYIIGILLGVVLVSLSIMTFFGNSDRVFDNVTSGENSVIGIIYLFLGLIILISSVFKAFSLKNPFGDLASSLDGLEKTPKKKKEETPEILKEPPIDREKYKIGEFDIKTLKSTSKPTQKKVETEVVVEEEIKEVEKEAPKKVDSIEEKSIDDIFSELDQVEKIDETIPIISLDDKIEKTSKKDEEE